MIKVEGRLFPLITGGYGAIIDDCFADNHNGIVFVQSGDINGLSAEVRSALMLHFEADGNSEQWIMVPLVHLEPPFTIAITESGFDFKSHQYALSALVYDRDSIRDNDNYITYKIGSTRFTMPKFEKSEPSPELLYQIFYEYEVALKADSRTANNVQQILRLLFARPSR